MSLLAADPGVHVAGGAWPLDAHKYVPGAAPASPSAGPCVCLPDYIAAGW